MPVVFFLICSTSCCRFD